MPDHAVVGDRLAEQVRVAFRVGGELAHLLGRDLRRVHAGHALRLRQLPVPGAEPQPHVADVHGRAARERAVGDRHVILAGLVAAQGRLEPHEKRRAPGHRLAAGDAVDVLAPGGQPGSGEPGPGLPPAQRAGDVKLPACLRGGERRAPGERGLDRREPRLVIGGEVQAQVVVVDHGLLEVGKRRRGRDRRGDPEHVSEVPRSPGRGEQQPGRPPRVAALQRAQRGLEQPGVRRRRVACDVEEQQPVELRGDQVALRVGREVGVPRVLPRGQPGRLGAERHDGDGDARRAGRAVPERLVDCCPGDSARADRSRGTEQQAAPARARELRGGVSHARHDAGCQRKVKGTVCGFSHTSWYSRWRAETGGEISRVSW